MHTSHLSWLRLSFTRLIIIGCSLLCVICLVSIFAFQHGAIVTSSTGATPKTLHPSITINAGFDDAYRVDYWTPVRVTLSNPGPIFNGKLAIQTFSGGYQTQSATSLSPWRFEQSISLNKGVQKQFTIDAPHYTGNLITQGFQATLLDEHGKTVASQISKAGYEVQPGNILIGTLSDDPALQAQLSKVQLPNQADAVTVSQLSASTMPTSETVLENFDVIILDNYATRTLSTQQIATLRMWINRGGILLTVGGTYWQKTLSPLPADLLPVSVQRLDLLPPHTHLLTFNGQNIANNSLISDIDTTSLTPSISTAEIHQNSAFSSIETLLSSNGTPLVIQAHLGSGQIGYIAFDPAGAPLDRWSSAYAFWQAVLESALGDKLLIATGSQSYDAGPGQILTRGGLVSFLTPGMPQGTIAIALLIIAYILLLGPARALLLRIRPQWRRYNSRMVISTILICSLLSYGIAYDQSNSAVTENSVSIIQVNQDGTMAHITTYMGVLAPRAGDLNLQIPGNNLAEPIDQPYLDSTLAISQQAHNDVPTTVTAGNNGTSLTMHNSDLWSVNPVITEQDQPLQGNIKSNLSLRNDRVIGTVTNNLATALTDVYILLPHNFIPLDHLAPRQTKKIDIQLKHTTSAAEMSLADQIEKQAGLPTEYFPYQNHQQPSNDFDLHMAMLSALSGAGYSYSPCEGSCQTHAITNKGIIYVTGGQIPDPNYKNNNDPLLLDNTQATLIGWAEQRPTQSAQSTMINNVTPQGPHLNFIQMPLNLTYSGVLDVPHDFITAHVMSIDSFDAAAILPGAYSLSSGSVTFSLNMPETPHAYINTITIRVPDLLNNPNGQGTSSPASNSTMQVHIYNWSTGKWEPLTLDRQGSFTTDALDTYAGPNSRILVKISSHNTNQIYFGNPQLNISGGAS
jgi:hypothetical protein